MPTSFALATARPISRAGRHLVAAMAMVVKIYALLFDFEIL